MSKIFIGTILNLIAFGVFSQHSVVVFEQELFTDIPNCRDFSISADEKEIYFTAQSLKQDFSAIMVSHKGPNGWSKPEVASFSGQYRDLEPFLSEDGLSMYFASNRLRQGSETDKWNYDIWKVERASITTAWSAAINLGAPINTDGNEFYPSIAVNGNLYFTAEREGTIGKEDIFVSTYTNGSYNEALPLSEAINSKGYEFNAYVDPNENFIMFTGYGREDGMGGGDLYISKKDQNGDWLKATHLDASINSNGLDYCPFVHKGILYFTSNRSSFKPSYGNALTTEELIEKFNNNQNGKSRIYKVLNSKWLGN